MTNSATSIWAGIPQFSSGSFTSDGTAVTITLGFKPRWVKLYNTTDAITWEKVEGMAAANSFKTVTAGTMTADTGSAILINTDGTITISTTAAGTAKAIAWVAQ